MMTFKEFYIVENKENELENIINKYKDKDVKVSAYITKHNDLTLSLIKISKENRNKGLGSQFMTELINFADKYNIRILLSPSIDFGASSVNRLKSFYKRFGFIENKGKNKNFTINHTMYRSPENDL